MRQYFTVADADDLASELVSLEDAKTDLGITSDDEDESLTSQIARISKAVADYCDRIFALAEVTEVFVFDLGETFVARQPLVLRHYPIASIESVSVDGVEILSDGYEYDQASGRIWLLSGAWSGRVEVEYTGGYDLPDAAPAALQWAVIEALRQRRAFSSSDATIRSTTHGDTTVQYNSEPVQGAAGFSRIVIDAIRSFKRWPI